MSTSPTATIPEQRRTRVAYYATLVLAVVLTYSPVLFYEYGFSEDYRLLAAFRKGVVLPRLMIAEGRPMQAVWSALFLGPIDTIGQLAIIRFLNLIVIGAVAALFANVWQRVGLTRVEAWLASFALLTLPSFQYVAGMAAGGVVIWGCLAAAAAAQLTVHGTDGVRIPVISGILLPAFLLLLGLTAYQPAGMIYWSFMAVLLVAPGIPWQDYWRRLRAAVVVGGMAMASALLLFEVGKRVFASELVGAPRAAWVSDPFGKFMWFMKFPIPHTLNLWRLYPDLWLALALMIGATAGLVLSQKGLKNRLFRTVVAFGLIPFSYLPSLVVAEDRSSFRSMVALASLVLAYYVIILKHQFQSPDRRWLFRVLLAVLATVGAWSAVRTVTTLIVIPQTRELAAVRQTVAGIDRGYDTILVIPSTWQDALAPRVLYDEFGYPSTALVWSSAAVTWLALMEYRNLSDTTAVRADTAGVLPQAPDTAVDWSEVLRETRLRFQGVRAAARD